MNESQKACIDKAVTAEMQKYTAQYNEAREQLDHIMKRAFEYVSIETLQSIVMVTNALDPSQKRQILDILTADKSQPSYFR